MERLQASRSLSSEQASVRIAAQRPVAEKLRQATEVITNNGSLGDLEAQIGAAWNRSVRPRLSRATQADSSP
jgi:dephospho-CoA kinase